VSVNKKGPAGVFFLSMGKACLRKERRGIGEGGDFLGMKKLPGKGDSKRGRVAVMCFSCGGGKKCNGPLQIEVVIRREKRWGGFFSEKTVRVDLNL